MNVLDRDLSNHAGDIARFMAVQDSAQALEAWEEKRAAELLAQPVTADDIDQALDRALMEKMAAAINEGNQSLAWGMLLLQLGIGRQERAEQLASDEAFELMGAH